MGFYEWLWAFIIGVGVGALVVGPGIARLLGLRTIQWTEEMEQAERKAWQEELDKQVDRIRENMGEERWQKDQKDRERRHKLEEQFKDK